MINQSDFFYGDYHGELNRTGVGFENDNNHVEVGRIYPIISLNSSEFDRVLIFETDVSFWITSKTDVEFVTEKDEIVYSISFDNFTFLDKHVEVIIPANTDDDISTLGVRFTEEVKAQVQFTGKIFTYNKENQINTIVNVPAD